MFSLPVAQGHFAIGATTFCLPVGKAITVGSSKLKVKSEFQPALQLEEVAFTAYYPARTESKDGTKRYKKGLNWISQYVTSY
jgi:platelet-activating factor acetylhydrolase